MRASCIVRIESAMRRRVTMLKANPGGGRAYWRSLTALRISPESEEHSVPSLGVHIQDQVAADAHHPVEPAAAKQSRLAPEASTLGRDVCRA
jgi:hypothetical protein